MENNEAKVAQQDKASNAEQQGDVPYQPFVQWVVKISKQCNLRCTYCYEFPYLSDPGRMSLQELERMFKNIADYYGGTGQRMDFVWHGGEPLLVPADVYRAIGDIQQEVLGSAAVPFGNSVQTNLVHLTDDVINLFGSFFSNVGVSIDLFGDQRVNVVGRPVQKKVLENMQRLQDAGIPFGGITVLSKLTAPHAVKIYQFFENIDAGFRFLPIYRTGYEGQQEELALTSKEIVDIFKKVVNYWMKTDSTIVVRPIHDYISSTVRYLSGGKRHPYYYNKLERELVYIINVDGSVYSNADAYDSRLCHGNIFKDSLRDMQKSDRYLRAVNAAHGRMERTCRACRFHGVCSGYYMGEATPEQRWLDEAGRPICGVAQPMQDYIERVLIDAGFVDSKLQSLVRDRITERIR